MLIPSHRHTPADLKVWYELEGYDAVLARARPLRRKVERAIDDIRAFAADPCYVGVSWGKDSVVVAHLASIAAPHAPLVWVRVEPIKNPDCALVRDAYLAEHGQEYIEINEHCTWSDDEWHATGTLERGFKRAAEQAGGRYISGVRSEESSGRKMREMVWGTTSANTCAPITRWTGLEVFAYLYAHDLPVHPAYACSFGGVVERHRIRVASIGGERGTGKGRREWEQRYYGETV